MEACLEIDPDHVTDFNTCFEDIATQLFSSYVLVINNQHYYLAELEFYLNHKRHADIFAHSDESQLTCGKWYFHRTGKAYRGGNYKGLDITFAKEGYGGILIRALKAVHCKEYIDGPCKVVDKILTLTGQSSIKDLVQSEDFSECVFEKGSFYLEACAKRETTIYASARVGLKLRNEKQIPFVVQPYRYLCFPYSVRKGRQHLVLELYYQGYELSDIRAITGCSPHQCEKWISSYDEGFSQDGEVADWFNRDLNVQEFSEFYGVLKRATET